MAEITASMVKELRDRTGVGMGKCKQALEIAEGDMDKAIANLRKEGMASAVKKEGRDTNEGLIACARENGVVSLVEVNTETDFVAKNERFTAFVQELANVVAKNSISSVEELAQQAFPGREQNIEEYRTELVQALGENIQVRRVLSLADSGENSAGVYLHMGGKIGALVELAGAAGQEDFAREIALHIAAENPRFLDESQVPQEVKEEEKEIARAQVKGKPEHIIEKILEGKLKAFYEQECLICQPFVKDSSVTVGSFVENKGKELGKALSIKGFTRWNIAK